MAVQDLSLTRSQYLIWAGQMLSPEAPLYNMPFRFDLYGKVDPERFRTAFQRLVLECDIMTASIRFDEDNLPVQHFDTDHVAQLEFTDLSSFPDAMDRAEALIHDMNTRQFNLNETMYESILIKVKEGHFIWYLNQHHIITDAWGISVQYKRMAQLYDGDVGSEELPVFADYVRFEREAPLQKGFKKSQAYWKDKLQEAPPLVSLYIFNSSRQSTRTKRYKLSLSAEKIKALSKVIKDPDIQSFTPHISYLSIFMTALFSFMYRVSGQRELSIGTPSHNRTKESFQNTPGPFIEFFPIMVKLAEDDSLGALYQKVRKEVMGFLVNARSGMATPELSSSFNVVLNYIHAEFPDFGQVPSRSEWLHIGHCDPRHDIRMHVIDYSRDGSIEILLDMNEEVIPEAQAGFTLDHISSVIDAFITDRSMTIDQVPLISNKEKELIRPVLTGRETGVTDLLKYLDHFCNAENTSTAIVTGEHAVTYADLNEKVNAISGALLEQLEPGNRVAIHLKRSMDYIASLVACLRTGMTFIPIPTNIPEKRVQFIIERSDPGILLTEKRSLKTDSPVLDVTTLSPIEREVSSFRLSGIPAYIMYTSGSTGEPKGVQVEYEGLCNYVEWCLSEYSKDRPAVMPLFTSVGFDLTLTSCLLPLCSGGTIHIYPEPLEGPDLSIMEVMKNGALNTIKLTPSHMDMVKDREPLKRLDTLIVGGEDFRAELARQFYDNYGDQVRLINEYGPTEATVGCITYQYQGVETGVGSVPIGKPINNTSVRIVNEALQDQPLKVTGEILIGGRGLAKGYWEDETLTSDKFIQIDGERYYRSGDLGYLDDKGQLHFLGRKDQQLKISGHRIEPAEISETALQLESITSGVVTAITHQKNQEEVVNCVSCGLPSNFPGVEFNEDNECSLCTNYASYAERVKDYFRTMRDLEEVFRSSPKAPEAQYDCMMLLSGGKDSTYALAKLADMGLNVLAFTLDNGYISQEALDNAQRVCRSLGVDHVFGRTDAMNEIFVDSLKRHHNVCNGCFKTIYTLATNMALEKKIPIIVTGLSRGQFFETRLTEELFWDDNISASDIDGVILNARKAYHQVDDAVTQLLDVSCFEDDDVFEKVRFVDFYRYSDVELSELMAYLKKKLPWVRPSDTGRSTNCLINQLGIYVHKKTEGYSNYAFPYSWDVRIGHKTREESLDEINEEIDENAVKRMMQEIGYEEAPKAGDQYLTLFYTSDEPIPVHEIKSHLEKQLPDYMIPWSYVRVDSIPLTPNGKVDQDALLEQYQPGQTSSAPFVEPETDIQKLLAEIWKEVLLLEKVGIQDKFLEMGGNSLMAIRIQSRINNKFRLKVPLNSIFKYPNIKEYGTYIEDTIRELMKSN